MNQGEKPKRGYPLFAVLLILFAVNLRVPAQGTFTNLNFESANLGPVPSGQAGGEVSSLDAIPGWTAFLGANQVTQVLQNNLTLGIASIDILGPNWNNSFGITIIEGKYTIVLQPGQGPSGPNVGASISQTGIVPMGTESIQFKAQADNFAINLGGQDLSVVALQTSATYTLYGANIPAALAGQNEALAVSVPAGPNTTAFFDSIVFSPNPIPEPGAGSLLLCGAGLLGAIRYARSKSNF